MTSRILKQCACNIATTRVVDDHSSFISYSSTNLLGTAWSEDSLATRLTPDATLCTDTGGMPKCFSLQLGPFTTFGGDDWTEGNIPNVMSLFDLPTNSGIIAHFAGAIDAHTYIPFGYPPLHNHHTHLSTPEAFVIAQAGDWQCPVDSVHSGTQSTECIGEDYGQYVKVLPQQPLALEFAVNDRRPSNAEPLQWWFQLSLSMTIASALPRKSPLSFFATLPKQGLVIVTTTTDTYYYYSGRMPFDGSLVSELPFHSFHSHKKFFIEALLLAGTPREIGFSDSYFSLGSRKSYIATRSVGFSASEFKTFLLTQARTNKVALVCTATGSLAKRGGLMYDRAASLTCDSWSFAEGDAFTAMALHGPAVSNHDDLPASDAVQTTKYFASHAVFMMHYIAMDGKSHYTYAELYPDVEMPPETPLHLLLNNFPANLTEGRIRFVGLLFVLSAITLLDHSLRFSNTQSKPFRIQML